MTPISSLLNHLLHRTFTAHQLAQLRLSLEEQHANELKELRKSYEAEKASLGEELAMVADAIRREVNDDSGERRDGGRSDSYDEVICSARMDQAIPSRIDQLDAQREADIQRRRIDLLQSLNADTLPSRAAPAADLLSSSSSTQEADAASTISSDAPESIAVPNVERSSAYPGRSKTFLKPKKSVRVEVLTKELTETTRHLSSLQRSYGTAQHQIMELEQLLESQRVAFQLSRAEQPSPRTNSNQDQKSRRSPTVETSVQTDSAGIQINRETSSSVDLIGPSKSMPTVELLTSEIKQQLKSMYLRHYAWMQALETAAYLHSDAGIDTVVSKADASMIASEFSSQIRILISMVDKMKMTVDKEVFDSCAEGTPLTTATALDGGVGAELRRLIGRVRDVENVLIDERY